MITYYTARQAESEGDYRDACESYKSIIAFKGCMDRVQEMYDRAAAAGKKGDYELCKDILRDIKDYKDSEKH